MTKDELKIKAETLKNKYLEKTLKDATSKIIKIKAALLQSERLIGKNHYTDQEIQDIASKEILTDTEIKTFESNYDINMFSFHNATINGVNLLDICGDMRSFDQEEVRYLAFSADNSFLGMVKSDNNTTNSVSGTQTSSTLKKLICQFPECKKVIQIHNHDHCAAAFPSELDGRTAWNVKKCLNVLGIELADDCIISELDFYSRKQDETQRNENKDKIFVHAPLSKELLEKIKFENKYIAKTIKD